MHLKSPEFSTSSLLTQHTASWRSISAQLATVTHALSGLTMGGEIALQNVQKTNALLPHKAHCCSINLTTRRTAHQTT